MAETIRRAGPRHSDETPAEFAARPPRYDDRVTFAVERIDYLTGFPHNLSTHQMAALREDVIASFTQDEELTWSEYAARIDGRWAHYADVLHSQQARALRLLEKSEALNTQRDEPADSHRNEN